MLTKRNSICRIACFITVIALTASFLAGCTQKPGHGGSYFPFNFYGTSWPNVTAYVSTNVYIAEILSVDPEVRTVAFQDEDMAADLKPELHLIGFTAKVEKVFKGEFAEGETVTDEVTYIYSDFLKPGKKYALCTGYDADPEMCVKRTKQ